MSLHPFSIAVFEDTIYWSDYGLRDIQSCHKFTGRNHKVVVKSARIQTYGIQIAHELLQPPYWSPCNKMRYVQGRWNKWGRQVNGSVVLIWTGGGAPIVGSEYIKSRDWPAKIFLTKGLIWFCKLIFLNFGLYNRKIGFFDISSKRTIFFPF